MSKYKYVIVDGCSFVKGHGCEFCHGITGVAMLGNCPHRFGALLSKRLDAQEVNIGRGGKSNPEILNSLYDAGIEYKKQSQECLVVIGTTHWMRSTLFKKLKGKKMDEIMEQKEVEKDYLRQYNLTLDWLKLHGFDCVIFNSFPGYSKEDSLYKENQLFWDLKGFKNNKISSWKLWCNMYDNVLKPKNKLTASDGHPSIYAHKEMAEKIYDFIRRD